MKIQVNNKMVNVPDDEINKSMKKLGLSAEQAIQMYLEDEGYIINQEQEALCKKAKDNRITATIHKAGNIKSERKSSTRERQANPTKEAIIAGIAEILPNLGAVNIKVENIR